MIRATLGEEIFQKGMQNYLQKYAFETADHIKYFDALTEVFFFKLLKKQIFQGCSRIESN